MIMDHTDQEREATRRRREDEATSTDEGEAANSAYQVPTSNMVTGVPTSLATTMRKLEGNNDSYKRVPSTFVAT